MRGDDESFIRIDRKFFNLGNGSMMFQLLSGVLWYQRRRMVVMRPRKTGYRGEKVANPIKSGFRNGLVKSSPEFSISGQDIEDSSDDDLDQEDMGIYTDDWSTTVEDGETMMAHDCAARIPMTPPCTDPNCQGRCRQRGFFNELEHYCLSDGITCCCKREQ